MTAYQYLIIIALICISIHSASSKRDKTEFSGYKRRLPKNPNRNSLGKTSPASKMRFLQNGTTTSPYVILVSPWVPMINCTYGDYNQSDFNGFTYDIWGLIATELDWPSGSYVFECVTPTEMVQRLSTGSNVTMADGAIRINQTLLNLGFKFAQPYYQSGLQVVIRKNVSRDMWSFLAPVTIEVGLGFICCTLVVAVMIWIFEERNWKRPYKEHVLNFAEVIYDIFSSYYETNSIELRTMAARITQWAFWFNVVVFVALYQADLTGQLSSNYYTQDFTTYQDGVSQMKRFATLDIYKNLPNSILYQGDLTYYSTQVSGGVNAAVTQMFNDLTNEVVDGLILDEPVAIYYSAEYCNLVTLDDVIYTFNYATMFPSGTPDSFILSISTGVTKLLETQQLNLVMKQDFESALNTGCVSGDAMITINELAGLWIILGCTIFIALIIYVIKKLKLVNMPENYMPPYYEYFTPKTQLFENQLKEAVEFEVGKILASYQEQVMEEIDNFERSLLLQEEKEVAKQEQGIDQNPERRWSLFKINVKDNSSFITNPAGESSPNLDFTPLQSPKS